jgi:replicative DNA helicase
MAFTRGAWCAAQNPVGETTMILDKSGDVLNEGKFTTGSAVIATWREDVLRGKPPPLWRVGDGELARIEVGPGLVNLLGGAPGSGKTALVMQWAADALRLNPELRVVVCNVEMSPEVLLDRQLARLSGVDLTTIRHRRLQPEHNERIERGLATLAEIGERLCFVRLPFNLENVVKSAGEFFGNESGLIVLDYLQRIAPPGDYTDHRSRVNAFMETLRTLASAGVGLIAVSAVARTKDDRGRSTYDADLGLASFRETSEIEYGADAAFILNVGGTGHPGQVTLRHLKDRYGECRDFHLNFDRAHQSFTSSDVPGGTPREQL